jgi:hypothetical protein
VEVEVATNYEGVALDHVGLERAVEIQQELSGG